MAHLFYSPRRVHLTGALLLPLLMALPGCGNSSSPVAPSGSAATTTGAAGKPDDTSPGQTRISVCHATDGTQDYVPVSIPREALDAHRAHGDGLVGGAVPLRPGMIFSAECTPMLIPSARVVVTFAGLTTNGASVASYSESGATVTATQPAWNAVTTYGNPASFIQFMAAAGTSVTGQVTVTASGALFSFTSVDLYSSTTAIPYTFTGTLGSTTVFSVTATQPQTFGAFATVINPEASAVIDTLTITLTDTAAPCCPNPMGLDNIVIRR